MLLFSSKTLLNLTLIGPFCFLTIAKAAVPTFLSLYCPNASSYAPNSTFSHNLNALFSSLASNSNRSSGFYNSTAGAAAPDVAYGLFLCRGDLSAAVCHGCVSFSATDVVERCPTSKVVTIWYDDCMVRYSNQSILFVRESSYGGSLRNAQNVTGVNDFEEVLGVVLGGIATQASQSLVSPDKMFATGESKLSAFLTVYALAQCTPDMTSSDCNACLHDDISYFGNCCAGSEGATVLSANCNIRYEMYRFYNAAAVVSSPGKRGISSKVLIAIIVSIGVAALLFIIGFCVLRGKAKKKHDNLHQVLEDEVLNIKSLLYDLGTIQVATNNFSNNNKIGEGGFGPVYKGTLSNGEEIAVKRLSRSSGQGAKEFKNELVLVAKLQHKSLVRLLGFCLKGEEKILIYEFMPNKSLNYFLFDPQEQVKLDWSRRYNIIGGIARGLLYLHEDSRLRIIHRDLKASNILLDGDMNAKISDFGMARIFRMDQTQENTNLVVGTFGYMSPEYIMHGQFSTKSDVFSFGVLVLEIITGKKNNRSFYQLDCHEDLPSHAWRHWRDETPLDLMDPTLVRSYSRNEVIRCIHIALLCVQEDPNKRPSMPMVVVMLSSYSVVMPLPQQPFFTRNITQSTTMRNQGTGQSMSKSVSLSVNEVSITKLNPR